jgi:hypothetical protein
MLEACKPGLPASRALAILPDALVGLSATTDLLDCAERSSTKSQRHRNNMTNSIATGDADAGHIGVATQSQAFTVGSSVS